MRLLSLPIDFLETYNHFKNSNKLTQSALQKHYCVSDLTIKKWLNRVNLTIDKKFNIHPNIKYSKPDNFVLEFRQCTSVKMLSKRLITPENIVRLWLKQDNLKYQKIKDIPYEELYDLHVSQGKSFKDIGVIYNASSTSITKLAQKLKIKNNLRDSFNLNKEELYNLHIIDKNTLGKIARDNKCSDVTVGNYCKKYNIEVKNYGVGKTSLQEQEVLDFVKLSFTNTSKEKIDNTEFDIVVKDKKIAIEYCGLFFHSDRYSTGGTIKHLKKLRIALNNNIFLLTIYSDEWLKRKEIVKSIIKSKLGIISNKIYARKCDIKIIDNKIANDFCEQNHIQGKTARIKLSFGLFYNDKLMSVMMYTHHPRNNSVVLGRFCNKIDTTIVGGASKMFIYSLKYLNTSRIISWSDNRWSNGNLYEQLGFKLEKELPPSYDYVSKDGYDRFSAQSMQKSIIGCPKEVTEREFLERKGIYRIWNCGKKRWCYSK